MRVLAMLVALMMPVQALALSCLPATVANTYGRAAKAPETFVIVHARLTFDETQLPKSDPARPDTSGGERVIKGRLLGAMMSSKGFFSEPFDKKVSIIAKCFGPWCPTVSSGIGYLAFVERKGRSYSVTIDPCGGDVFQKPTQVQLDQAKACHQGKRCDVVKY